MSNQVSPSHPTRQQLDELDALMQRMLALPVSPTDAETEPSSVDALVPEPPPLPETPPPTEFTAVLPPPPPPPIEDTAQKSSVAAPDAVVEEPAPRTSDQRPQIAAWVRPLLWSNRVFDRGTMRFGGAGRWLRSPAGRAWLGAAGLLMLATAVAWGVLDWMGWPW